MQRLTEVWRSRDAPREVTGSHVFSKIITLTNNNNSSTDWTVPGQLPPWTNPPRTITPRTILPQTIPTRTIPNPDNFPPRPQTISPQTIPTRTIANHDNCPPENSHSGEFPTLTIDPQTIPTRTIANPDTQKTEINKYITNARESRTKILVVRIFNFAITFFSGELGLLVIVIIVRTHSFYW